MIQIGDILTLELKSSDHLEKFRCRLVDKREDQYYIDYPINMQTNRVAFLFDGTELRVTFAGHDGASILGFETEIIGRVREKIPMLIIHYPGDDQLIRIQRRQFVRIATSIDIAIHPLDFEFEPIATVTDDISAGGTAILVPKETVLKKGMFVQAWLVLVMQAGDYHYLKMHCRVVRTEPYNEMRNRVSLQFMDVSNRERQLLLRFCFERQLKNKKKDTMAQHKIARPLKQ